MRSVQDLQKQVQTAEKKVLAIKIKNSFVLSFVFQSLGDLFGHSSKISFEN